MAKKPTDPVVPEPVEPVEPVSAEPVIAPEDELFDAGEPPASIPDPFRATEDDGMIFNVETEEFEPAPAPAEPVAAVPDEEPESDDEPEPDEEPDAEPAEPIEEVAAAPAAPAPVVPREPTNEEIVALARARGLMPADPNAAPAAPAPVLSPMQQAKKEATDILAGGGSVETYDYEWIIERSQEIQEERHRVELANVRAEAQERLAVIEAPRVQQSYETQLESAGLPKEAAVFMPVILQSTQSLGTSPEAELLRQAMAVGLHMVQQSRKPAAAAAVTRESPAAKPARARVPMPTAESTVSAGGSQVALDAEQKMILAHMQKDEGRQFTRKEIAQMKEDGIL